MEWLLIYILLVNIHINKCIVNEKTMRFNLLRSNIVKIFKNFYILYLNKNNYKIIYLIDPVWIDVLILKIKPCMCKYNVLNMKPRKAHYNSYRLHGKYFSWITEVILELIHAIYTTLVVRLFD